MQCCHNNSSSLAWLVLKEKNVPHALRNANEDGRESKNETLMENKFAHKGENESENLINIYHVTRTAKPFN